MTNRPIPAWGKFNPTTRRRHRLEHHCADVAACFEVLLNEPVQRARFECAAGGAPFTRTTVARLTVLAYLHDYGKVNALFQAKTKAGDYKTAGHVGEALLCLDEDNEITEALRLHTYAAEWGPAVAPLLRAALAHHGRPPTWPGDPGAGDPAFWRPDGDYDPIAGAVLLEQCARDWFPDAYKPGPELPDTPALAHLFAGAVALADHLGSDEEQFEYEPDACPGYIDRARETAARTLQAKGIRRDWAGRTQEASVKSLFGHDAPRAAQEAIAAVPTDVPLVILESETGSGKTEAAVLRFAALMKAGKVDGLYVVLKLTTKEQAWK